MTPDRRWWTVAQVAELLDKPDETVRRWLRGGSLPGRLIGGDKLGYRIERGHLAEFVELRLGTTLEELEAARRAASIEIAPSRDHY